MALGLEQPPIGRLKLGQPHSFLSPNPATQFGHGFSFFGQASPRLLDPVGQLYSSSENCSQGTCMDALAQGRVKLILWMQPQ